jgi:hypothetical protein
MKEEEIIEFLNKYKDYKCDLREYNSCIECENKVKQAIQDLLDLYEKEKEKNKELQYKLEVEKIDNKYNQEERDEETIPKYKIREKIEELDKQEKAELKGVKGQDRYFIKQIYQAKRKILQELLEEE